MASSPTTLGDCPKHERHELQGVGTYTVTGRTTAMRCRQDVEDDDIDTQGFLGSGLCYPPRPRAARRGAGKSLTTAQRSSPIRSYLEISQDGPVFDLACE